MFTVKTVKIQLVALSTAWYGPTVHQKVTMAIAQTLWYKYTYGWQVSIWFIRLTKVEDVSSCYAIQNKASCWGLINQIAACQPQYNIYACHDSNIEYNIIMPSKVNKEITESAKHMKFIPHIYTRYMYNTYERGQKGGVL